MIAYILTVLFWLGMVSAFFAFLCAEAAQPRNRKWAYLGSGVGFVLCTAGFIVACAHIKPIFSPKVNQNGCAQVQQM